MLGVTFFKFLVGTEQTTFEESRAANMARPSLAGWWRCCQCQYDVNSALWGDDCPMCTHEKCDDCLDLASGAVPARPVETLSSTEEGVGSGTVIEEKGGEDMQ